MAYRHLGDNWKTAVDRAADQIRTRIRDGAFVPGQRLVAAELSRELAVSLGPLREALTRLAGQGLVEVQPHRGAIVRTQSIDELVEIYEIRELIEGLAARLAARAVGTDERPVQPLQRIAEQGRRSAENFDLLAYLDANQAFHEAIYALSGTPRLANIARTLSDQIDRLRHKQLGDHSVLLASATEHDAIVAAIAAGNEAAAEALMRGHVASMGRKITGRAAR